jgi:hypothetical protein
MGLQTRLVYLFVKVVVSFLFFFASHHLAKVSADLRSEDRKEMLWSGVDAVSEDEYNVANLIINLPAICELYLPPMCGNVGHGS